jgi:hypothetical protein
MPDIRETYSPTAGGNRRAAKRKQARQYDGATRPSRTAARLRHVGNTDYSIPTTPGSRVERRDVSLNTSIITVTYRVSPGPRKTEAQRNSKIRVIRP